MMKTLRSISSTARAGCVLLVLSTLACPLSLASAATLVTISPAATSKLFTTEIKRDERADGGQAGHDVFLRNADTFSGPSSPFNWGVSGTSYAWSLAYDGDHAFLSFAGAPALDLDVNPDGAWNAIKIITRSQDAARFDSAQVTVEVNEINGASLLTPHVYMAMLSEFNEVTLGIDSGAHFTGLAGTLKYDFAFKPSATGSPNSQFAFIIKGFNAVPEPSGLLLGGLGMVVLMTRRLLN